MNARVARRIRRYVATELGAVLDHRPGITTASDGVSSMATAGQMEAAQRRAKAAYKSGGWSAIEDLVDSWRQLAKIGEL